MTKKELHATVVAAVRDYLGEENEGLEAILAEHLAPKVGGASVNIEDVVKRDEDGTITEILCSTSGVWLPATAENFYEDKSDKPRIVNAEGTGLKRQSKAAEKISKEFNKAKRASINALTDDILASDDIDEINALKDQLRTIKESKPDYSAVAA